MIDPAVRFRLEDMRDHAREAIEILGERSAAEVQAERLRELALVRLLEIVGEAAAHVPPDARSILPGVPWPKVVGLRNMLIHGYGQVRLEIVVDVVRGHLPSLLATLEDFLAKGTSE